jgi:hypothetical protein
MAIQVTPKITDLYNGSSYIQFNGTGGGTSQGGGGAYVGFNPPTPVILGAFAPIAGP